ncbi:MAG TPA: DoxX family protein [Thermoanaerobaculia bacterium]|nr:DoxX family protein [Thermoanaerobaculia bacterium]
MTDGRAVRLASPGHAVFAATLVALGLMGLVTRDFSPIWPPVPEGMPGRAALVYLCALVPLLCGVGLFLRRPAAAASRVLFGYFLLWLLLLRVPGMVVSFTVDHWWAACQTAAMTAAAWVLFAWFAGDERLFRFATGDRGLRVARRLYGLALIPFGLAHFLYLQPTIDDVPAWMPGRVAWAYLTGVTFIAAGVAIVAGVRASLAAALSALQMGLFTLLVWVPVVLAGPNPFQWSEFVVSWALTAAGWVVADSYRNRPWTSRP